MVLLLVVMGSPRGLVEGMISGGASMVDGSPNGA